MAPFVFVTGRDVLRCLFSIGWTVFYSSLLSSGTGDSASAGGGPEGGAGTTEPEDTMMRVRGYGNSWHCDMQRAISRISPKCRTGAGR